MNSHMSTNKISDIRKELLDELGVVVTDMKNYSENPEIMKLLHKELCIINKLNEFFNKFYAIKELLEDGETNSKKGKTSKKGKS
jgi:hypothetical protein